MTDKNYICSFFGKGAEKIDYSGRTIKKTAFHDENDPSCPTIDYIRPLQHGGNDDDKNRIICSILTKKEKNNSFPTWNANGKTFQAKRVKGKRNCYQIWGSK